MSVITVTNSAQLASAIQAAKAGDTIQLAGGNYGDVAISGKAFSGDVSIVSADQSNPAIFSTLTVKGSENINFSGIHVDFVPGATTYSFSSAVMINNSKGITFANGVIEGGPAVNGVPITATDGDSTGNVQGLPAGRGITIQSSSDITVQGSDISQFHRGIVMSASKDIQILGNEVHDTRASTIVGGSVSDVVIDGNHLHSVHPWNWGSGDHADFIAIWVDEKTQTSDSTGIRVTNNVMEQGDGTAILGMWLKGQEGLGFKDVVIEDNVIMNGNFQGITLGYVSDASVSHNALIQTSGDSKDGPSILLKATTSDIVATDNIAWTVHNLSVATGDQANQVSNNTLIQKTAPSNTGYYDDASIAKLWDFDTADAIYDAIAKIVGRVGDGGVAPPVVLEPAPQEPAPPVPPPSEGVNTPDRGDDAPIATPGETIVGNGLANKLVGGAGDDTIDGRGGSDELLGGSGNDTYFVPNTLARITENAGEGIDTVIARGDHVLASNLENLTVSSAAKNGWAATGNELNNVIIGNEGGNKLSGLSGDDTIDGGAGNDTIIGGEGRDHLVGGEGADVFKFAIGSGHDVVHDFGVGRDTLDISELLKAGIKAVVIESGDDTVVSLSNGDTITLIGVEAAHLKSASAGFIYS